MKLFVSGTDTGIGKTVVTCALLRALDSRGLAAIGMKPVATGITPQGTWDDVEQIRLASRVTASLDDMAPFRLGAPASPHFAAREDGVTIRAEVILGALDRLERLAEAVVIEGVGGFRVPLSERLDSADLAQAMRAPVLLVVPMRLGCINHALLTAESVAGRGLSLLGWVANAGIDSDYTRVELTVDSIADRIQAPCIGVLPRLALGQNGADHLNIDPLLARLRSLAATDGGSESGA
ncbi:MAG: dethiobiotin synthase [Betaproteobacteria bacterium RIFCSPLOWO2_02_FULL_63_19]|nr:MAG: dethiobiotin synthase [Betaproteobacteria bacterium RIFCSPLOWO2_02_FULL_63_19]